MPARQPFTALCRAVAPGPPAGRFDLHVHTTASDGEYTPAQVVELGRLCGLCGVAVTDHDTLSGVGPALAVASGSGLDVVAGVEITSEHRGRELHLLGYFVRLDDAALLVALNRLRVHRAGRFREMVERLRGCGVSLDESELPPHAEYGTLGRRHLAMILVKSRRAGSVREAFARYLGDHGRAVVPKLRLPLGEAVAVVRNAGGVAAWAHPPADCTRDDLDGLAHLGVGAVEVEYPASRSSHARRMRAWAAELGLAVTGGSDCHGPGAQRSALGARGVTGAEVDVLRRMSSS